MTEVAIYSEGAHCCESIACPEKENYLCNCLLFNLLKG
jgi:hypothetical protein